MSTLPDRQVARIALMLLKHGERTLETWRNAKEWTFLDWVMYADPENIVIYKSTPKDPWSATESIPPRSQLGLAIRKS
jgi:hypothetical protein